MKPCIILFLSLLVLNSCINNRVIIDKTFTDSLLAHYSAPEAYKITDADLLFWKTRINPQSTGLVNESRYAAPLINRFQQRGDISDVKTADSILQLVNIAYNEK